MIITEQEMGSSMMKWNRQVSEVILYVVILCVILLQKLNSPVDINYTWGHRYDHTKINLKSRSWKNITHR